jgi:shikimate dehydrogenase
MEPRPPKMPNSEALSFLRIITGSFARPAGENPTVAMVEAAYRHHSINACYINCEVAPDALADAVRGARAMGWAGFNCSIPHKVAVVPMLDSLARSASIIGAVNCVVVRDGALVGENTDGQGFIRAMHGQRDPSGQDVVVLGAGGAARAIAIELALAGATCITVVNRDQGRGSELARLISNSTSAESRFVIWDKTYRVPASTTVLVNATPVGLFPDVAAMPDVELDTLKPGILVADVIPNPPRTRLLAAAEERGSITLDGLGMLVEQGVLGIAMWTGVSPDPRVMRRALVDALTI